MVAKHFMRALLGALVLGGGISLGVHAEGDAPGQDQIQLKDGSTIIGKVTGARDGSVTIDTAYTGTLVIAMENVLALQTREDVVIQLADSTVVADQPLRVQQEQLVIADQVADEQTYALSDLLLVNPEPWELGKGYKWTGLASAAMVAERGNTDSDELDFAIESVWRSLRDRYTFRFTSELDETNGEKTTEKWYSQGKYDYFLEGPDYTGLQLVAEHDKFTDLDLRVLVGPFLGRQFYEEPVFTLSGEVGVAWVDEDYIKAEDQDYASATWASDASSDYLGGDSRLYFRNRGVWNLEETSDYIVNTTLGLAFPLLWNFEAAAELVLDYDSGAVDDVDELDQTYRFRLGYSW
jgi:hypothetical protein